MGKVVESGVLSIGGSAVCRGLELWRSGYVLLGRSFRCGRFFYFFKNKVVMMGTFFFFVKDENFSFVVLEFYVKELK